MGQVHINLEGVRPEGIVQPGTEYEALKEQIAHDAPGLSEDEMAEMQEKLQGWGYAG